MDWQRVDRGGDMALHVREAACPRAWSQHLSSVSWEVRDGASEPGRAGLWGPWWELLKATNLGSVRDL